MTKEKNTKHKNYLKLARPSFLYRYFCFVDTDEFLADDLFISQKIRVYFLNDYRKEESKYCFVICKVRKRNVDKFLYALERLETKMLLAGHYDYPAFCKKEFQNLMRA